MAQVNINFVLDICFYHLEILIYRNEVWRFDPQFGSMSKRPLMLKSASTGMKLGFILFVGAVILETGYNRLFGKKDHHGHH